MSTKNRFSYHTFIIWGHGLVHKEEIEKILDKDKNTEVIFKKNIQINNIKKYIDSIYSADFVPLEHLRGKTKYLLDTPNKAVLILVKNSNPNEKYMGEGEFRHLQCLTIKELKEEIRNKFNPRVNGKRTEHHVIHATDVQDQVEHILRASNINTSLPDILRMNEYPIVVPEHIRLFSKFEIIEVKLSDLYAGLRITILKIFNRNIVVPLQQTPHYRYLVGDRKRYLTYNEQYDIDTDEHGEEQFNNLIKNFSYLKKPYQNHFILVFENKSGKLQILDGVHRAAILKYQGKKNIRVAKAIYD